MKINPAALRIIRQGGVWVPSPLALTVRKQPDEGWQRLLTLYYIRSGAQAVVPGTHTGEFAGHGYVAERKHLEILNWWLELVKTMTRRYGRHMVLMAMVSGIKQAELAARHGYDMAIVSPRSFQGMSDRQKISFCREIASIIPVFGFYLQPKAGGLELSPAFWKEFFKFGYGAKLAPFDRYRTLKTLEAGAESKRFRELTFITGNDDHIIPDLMRVFRFHGQSVEFRGGLLGHYATDTHAAVGWTTAVLRQKRRRAVWRLGLPIEELSDAVTLCNDALFDASPNNFQNSIWGVKYRLSDLGLLKAPFCFAETGRSGMPSEIRARYDGRYRAYVSDRAWLRDNLAALKKESGVI